MAKTNYKPIIILSIVFVLFLGSWFIKKNISPPSPKKVNFWQMESIDTVKYSRDDARQYSNDPSFDSTIDAQVKVVAETGASHIALGTPYDPEFVPFLQRWVNAARKYGLNVWFRGNFSGWEGWFDYKPITRGEHQSMLKQFILDNGNLFEDGDIFTSCTECENGGPGDPRNTGDVVGHRQFLTTEYGVARNAFSQISKNVTSNYFPMNLDVARLVMDPATTENLGGVVVIDHYVPTPYDLNQGINDIAISSGGKVILGEFGAPIPDLQGNLTEKEQADWIKKALSLLAANKNLIGVNYWTSFGGSTKIWHDDGTKTLSVDIVKNFYTPKALRGTILNEKGSAITNATLVGLEKSVSTNIKGQFYIPYLVNEIEVGVSAPGYYPSAITNIQDDKAMTVILKKQNESLIFKLQKMLYQNFGI